MPQGVLRERLLRHQHGVQSKLETHAFRISLGPVSFILQLMVLFVHTEERADPVFLVP